MGTDLQLRWAFAVDSAAGLVATADLEFTPAARMQMGQHPIHGDIEPLRAGRSNSGQVVAGGALGDLLRLMGHQGRAKLLGRVAHTVGADGHQRETLKHRGSFSKGILGGAEEGKEFIEAGAASPGTEAELRIQGMLAVATGATEIVGALKGEGAEDGADGGRALALIGSEVTTGTGDGAGRLGGDEQGRQAGHQGRSQVLDDAEDMLFDRLQVVRGRLHPGAECAGDGRHALAHGRDKFFQTGAICASMHPCLLR